MLAALTVLAPGLAPASEKRDGHHFLCENWCLSLSFRYDRYPAWVDSWNRQKLPIAYADKSWELMHEKSSYLFGDADDKPWETDLAGYGRVFPHPYGPATGKYFNTRLTLSPAGDELTLAFAKTLIDAEQIGQDEVTDYLSVSFSSTAPLRISSPMWRNASG